nr:c-type cytochrome [Ardenticatenia bacterium]
CPPKLAAQAPPSFPPNFGGDERGGKRSSSAIAVTSDGAFCLVVNPDSNSLSIVDTVRPPSAPPNPGREEEEKVAEIPVGLDPRTVAVDDAGSRAYIANRGSDSVSVVDLTTHTVITEIPVGDRPYGVVVSPSGDRLYVAEQGADRLIILDTTTFETVNTISVADRPSGLAISDDGRTLYVTHLLTNTITVITLRPHAIYLPLILKSSVAGNRGFASSVSGVQQPIFNLQSLVSNIPLWPDSNLVQSIVLSPDGYRAYVPHTRSNTSNRALTFDTTVFPLVSLIDLTSQQHLVGQQIDLGTLDPPGVGLPFDAVVTPDSKELWVLNAASNDISVIDLTGNRLTAHIEVGDNPRGIALSPDGATAYINNTLAGTVSVVDTANYTVTATITVTDIPLPPALLNGKRLFHTSDDPRLSLAQWISCNTCHFEGEHDGRTWFFGFAGPRNTTSLLGMIETYPLRWSGEWDESADSEFANRKENFGSGLIDGEMNCSLSPPDCVNHPPNQGRSYDLDCLALFIDSLPPPPSPGPPSEAALRGQAIFNRADIECATCHPAPLYTDLQMHDVGTVTADERIGPEFDTPTLRGLYDSEPYFHDGSAATLYEAVTYPSPGNEHDLSGLLTEAEIQDLIAFLLALPIAE